MSATIFGPFLPESFFGPFVPVYLLNPESGSVMPRASWLFHTPEWLMHLIDGFVEVRKGVHGEWEDVCPTN